MDRCSRCPQRTVEASTARSECKTVVGRRDTLRRAGKVEQGFGGASLVSHGGASIALLGTACQYGGGVQGCRREGEAPPQSAPPPACTPISQLWCVIEDERMSCEAGMGA